MARITKLQAIEQLEAALDTAAATLNAGEIANCVGWFLYHHGEAMQARRVREHPTIGPAVRAAQAKAGE